MPIQTFDNAFRYALREGQRDAEMWAPLEIERRSGVDGIAIVVTAVNKQTGATDKYAQIVYEMDIQDARHDPKQFFRRAANADASGVTLRSHDY